MKKFGSFCKPLTWFVALLLAALAAGCGSGGGNGAAGLGGPAGPPTAAGAGKGVGGAGRGPSPVNLGTAGNFVILSVVALTNAGPSVVTGNVGLARAAGRLIGLTCAEVNGTIYSMDNSGPSPCSVTDPDGLAVGETDGDNAFIDVGGRVPDYTELAAGNIGGLNLGPATYQWSTAVSIPTNVTLTGGPNDVWIFKIAEGLTASSGVRVILAGGALPQNIYWAPTHDVRLESGSHFKGVLLPAAAVFMGNGASINGKLLAFAVHLDHNTVGP